MKISAFTAAGASAAGSTGRAATVATTTQEHRKRNEARRQQVIKERRILFPLLAGTLLLIPNFGRVTVTGKSMQPTLQDKQNVALLKSYRLFSPLKEGDIVVIRKKDGELAGQELIKRIAFIQNSDGNKPFPEKLQTPEGVISFGHLFPAEALGFNKIPPDTMYVLGDNLPVSTDSRDSEVGAVTDEEVVGKVLFVH